MKKQPVSSTTVNRVFRLDKQWQTADPFLFCAHHEDFYPKGNGALGPAAPLLQGRNMGQDFSGQDGFSMYHGDTVPGFPGHPHRGFETVTVVLQGLVDHADSLGASGRYGSGDTQWMTAGAGVQHSEMFPLVNEDEDNTLELFQIWLNLPAKNKKVPPHFKMLWQADTPIYTSQDKQVKALVVAGELDNTKACAPPPDSWAADPANAVAIWVIDIAPNATWTMPAATADVNRTLYFFKGASLKAEGVEMAPYHGAQLAAEQDIRLENGPEKARLLLLQGKPIAEPVAQYGPFVMNTPEEIQQTFADYRATQFGGWPWEGDGPTHGKSHQRFAKHANGEEETPLLV